MTPAPAPGPAPFPAASALAADLPVIPHHLLICVDAGDTLGTFSRPGTPDVLADLSPVPLPNIAAFDRNVLHTASALSDQLVADICLQLRIAPGQWGKRRKTGGFAKFGYAAAALAALAKLAPVAVLSNCSIIAGPRRMSELEQQLGDYLSGIYSSFALGVRKPDPACWEIVAAHHGRTVDQLVHIGDRVDDDVRGALDAGCALAILTNTRGVPVPSDLAADPRVVIVDDLRDASRVLRTWSGAPPVDTPAPWRRRPGVKPAVAVLRRGSESAEQTQ